MSGRKLRVFLCHASEDKPIVHELYRQLTAEGWMDVWLDSEKLFPGQDWNLEIEKAVEVADVILVCLSNNSITKEGYVQRELRIVLDYADYKPEGTLYLIPIRLENCEAPRRLRSWQYADYFPEKNREHSFLRLLVSLRLRAESLGISTKKPEPKRSGPVVSAVKPGNPARTTPGGHLIFTFGGLEFVQVPKGGFIMGSKDDNKLATRDEHPQHLVIIRHDFWMGRFPVTNVQYAQFAGSVFKIPQGKENHPVIQVSWNDSQKYIAWLNQRFVKTLPQGYVFRLPTEAEWEKAARGEIGNEWPWGNVFDKSKCNSSENGKRDTTPVKTYSLPNNSPYGTADMVGNVWEWTHSLFKSYPYNSEDGREDEKASGIRVVRGGSFLRSLQKVRAAPRGNFPDHTNHNIGFRVAIAPPLL